MSKGYFGSKNCLREVRTAVEKAKPLALVHDPVRGGATFEAIWEDECPDDLTGIFEGRNVIVWHRIKVPNVQAPTLWHPPARPEACTRSSVRDRRTFS